MKVTLDLNQALLSRIYAVRSHVHKNSRRAAFPEMELSKFLTTLISASTLLYALQAGLEVMSDDPS